MTFVKPQSFDGNLARAAQASACRHNSVPTTWNARCPGAPKAPPAGREALDAARPTWYSERGTMHRPRRRRTIEGASTTSHADMRWLPQLAAAEHT
jgi:hypothetical protein